MTIRSWQVPVTRIVSPGSALATASPRDCLGQSTFRTFGAASKVPTPTTRAAHSRTPLLILFLLFIFCVLQSAAIRATAISQYSRRFSRDVQGPHSDSRLNDKFR